ncbi:basic salivary proline-rich protein 1-like [Gouania willdenowi]|uniref:basic salivary proline-rich protein 1-like n=1 Tax=Gouania willdenowi TaxID=441366 RepID=UPI001056BA71|nr:basic salivary proline-rich protein 1-like [Gouania willdenowi]
MTVRYGVPRLPIGVTVNVPQRHPSHHPNPTPAPNPPRGGPREPTAQDPSRGAKAHAQQTARAATNGQLAGTRQSSTGSSTTEDNDHTPGRPGQRGDAARRTPSPQAHRPSPPERPRSPFFDTASASVITKVPPAAPPTPKGPGRPPHQHAGRVNQRRFFGYRPSRGHPTPHPLVCRSAARTTRPGRPPPGPAKPAAKPAGPQEHPPRSGTLKGETPGEAPRGEPPPNPAHKPATVKQDRTAPDGARTVAQAPPATEQRKPQGNATHRRASDQRPPPQEGDPQHPLVRPHRQGRPPRARTHRGQPPTRRRDKDQATLIGKRHPHSPPGRHRPERPHEENPQQHPPTPPETHRST